MKQRTFVFTITKSPKHNSYLYCLYVLHKAKRYCVGVTLEHDKTTPEVFKELYNEIKGKIK